MFSVLHQVSLGLVNLLVISACEMTHHSCACTGLRKMYALFFKFSDESAAKEFMNSFQTVSENTQLLTKLF